MIKSKKNYIILFFVLCTILFFSLYERSSSVSVEETVSREVKAGTLYKEDDLPPRKEGKYQYLEITESCNSEFEGLCIPVYSGAGIQYEKIGQLRNGMVLKIKSTQVVNNQAWHHVYFDEWLRHPERVEGDWYIPAVAGRVVTDDGLEVATSSKSVSSKRIIVDLAEHMLYAYDGNKEFMVTKIAAGLASTPTPRGVFTIYKKTPSRYMQGPLPGVNDNPFDLPGVPWNLYFTEDGAVIHGSYWHDRYGTDQSSGCINLPPELAKVLYDWADVGTTVEVLR